MRRITSVADRRGQTLLFAALAASLALAPLCALAAPSADSAEHSIHSAHMAPSAEHHGHGSPQLASHDAGHAKQHCAPEFCCSAVVGKRAETDDRDRAAAPAATAVAAGNENHAPGGGISKHERGSGGTRSRACVDAPLRL